MKRHSLLESQLNFPHSETHLKVLFFNYSLQCAHFCPQTYKAPISRMTTACALPRNLLISFSVLFILVCICPPLPQGHGHIAVSVQWAFGASVQLGKNNRVANTQVFPRSTWNCAKWTIKQQMFHQASWSCCSQIKNSKSAIQLPVI